ncbi:MAG TPA: hypothetical protein PKC13_27515 [Blastocatellia bacterium]|nr:hypothetical protein [Blastocatellia bacterium]HMX29365.1 hypothetical protein [Blastocatellia bacterium]HNG28327.1 hypothetical protein [Blastocatellia bacterium]
MKSITYQIKLREPMLVTSLSGDPNSATSFDYLPGSVLRGFFIGKYLQQHSVDLSVDTAARRLFFSGETCWLNAYPLDRLSNRCLPTPLSLNRIKGIDEKEIYDLAVDPQKGEDVQWTKVSSSFCQFANDHVRLTEPERQVNVHTARTRRYGRAVADEKKLCRQNKGDVRGAVYRYDALAAGQFFEGVVLCRNDDVAEIKKLLNGKAQLGKSQNAGYGHATIENVSEPNSWSEYPLPNFLSSSNENDSLSSQLIITLLSDVLLRDVKTGQYVVEAEAVRSWLQNQLGGSLTLTRAFLGQEIFGGFNRKWGLPLPQTQAITAGSVFVYQAANISQKKLCELLEKGIGERRAEGFGRFAVNWQTKDKLKVDEEKYPKVSSVTLNGDEAKLAEKVAERILRQRLEQRVAATGLKFKVTASTPNAPMPVSKSQLSRLRGLVQEELMKPESERSLTNVAEFIEKLKDRNTTRKQFRSARVGNKQLDEWLIEQLGNTEDGKWLGLFGLDTAKSRVSIGGIAVQPTEQLKQEYLLRWLETFLARTAKQSGKGDAK